MTSVFSWQNSINLFPDSFCTPRPNLPVTSGILLTPYFCIPVPYNEKDSSFGCYFQKVLQVFIKWFNFSFFSITGQGIHLDYCDIEWFAMEMNRDHSVIFDIASKYCISGSFVDCDGYSISSKGFLPTAVDIMVILVNFTHSSPFQFADSQNVNVHSCNLLFDHFQFALRFLYNIALYNIGPCFYHQSHPQLGIVFALAPSLHSF